MKELYTKGPSLENENMGGQARAQAGRYRLDIRIGLGATTRILTCTNFLSLTRFAICLARSLSLSPIILWPLMSRDALLLSRMAGVNWTS